MVTQWMETRDRRECALDHIRELAAAEAVHFASSRVQRDTANLKYSLQAVCKCLATLTDGNFKHSVRYSESGPWMDVYLVRYRGPTDQDDPLYIKFSMTRNCLCVVLHSFHLEGAL